MQDAQGMIDVPLTSARIRRVYDFYSHFYFLTQPLEKAFRMRGVELGGIKAQDDVLEVAVGAGYSFLEILRRVAREKTVFGIDLSPRMVGKTRRRAIRNGFSNFDLREGDARSLPFPDGRFDVLYNSYMLDLIPLSELPVVVGEFHRVLKDDGRLVLINLSKKNRSPILYEKLYRLLPSLMGGCRPVLMQRTVEQAGFENVRREFMRLPLSTEIITATR